MNSSIRAKTVLRETLPGQLRLPLYCGQRNSTKFTSTPRVSHRDSAQGCMSFTMERTANQWTQPWALYPWSQIGGFTVQHTTQVYLSHACIAPLSTVSVRPAFAFNTASREGHPRHKDHMSITLSHPCLLCEVWVDGKVGTSWPYHSSFNPRVFPRVDQEAGFLTSRGVRCLGRQSDRCAAHQ